MTTATRSIAMLVAFVIVAACLPFSARADAADWSVELKGGRFTPDLDDYGEFYGGDDSAYFAIAATWLARPWLEVGTELGYFDDDGVGVLPATGGRGAPVEYTLWPLHVFATVRGLFAPGQLFVPYAGAGATIAYYEQQVSQQPDRSGRTDLGWNARAGVQLLLDRVDPVTAAESGLLENTYLFVEGQWFSTEIDDIDLGGYAWLLGFKLEF
ncbi:MAG TPA: hypothetical protein VLT59_03875 [Steroidobacteraceae bacterium]|nr:hypothetical protein [Steroidobacteraceae bacterium]